MKKKIIAIVILGMFLLTSVVSISALGLKTESNIEKDDNASNYGYLGIHVHQGFSGGGIMVPDVKVTCEGVGLLNKDYYKVSYTGSEEPELGIARFGYEEGDNLPVPGFYRVTGEKEGYNTNSDIIFVKGSLGTSLALFKSKDRTINRVDLPELFGIFLVQFPLLQRLLNL